MSRTIQGLRSSFLFAAAVLATACGAGDKGSSNDGTPTPEPAPAPVVTVVSVTEKVVIGDSATLVFYADVAHEWQLELGGQGLDTGTLVAEGTGLAELPVNVEVPSTGPGVGVHTLRLYVSALGNGPESLAVVERTLTVLSDLRVLLIYGYNGAVDADMIAGSLASDARIAAPIGTIAFGVTNPTPPALASLESYDVILFWWNRNSSLDATARAAFGNRFADYVDAGGALVTLTYPSATDMTSLLGRARTEAYLPLLPASSGPLYTEAAATLGSYEASNPVLDDVEGLTCTRRAITELTPDAESIATWTDGNPLAARKGRIVSLALELSALDTGLSGSWGQIVANSLVYAATRAEPTQP